MKSKSEKPHLSVIVPVYNETDRLSNFTTIAKFLRQLPFSTELIAVNDGSTDETHNKLKGLGIPDLKIISYQPNRGKGYAIKHGMLHASGEHRLFMDIDLSVPLKHITEFLPHLGEHDIVFGTRKRHGAKVTVKQPWLRETLGKGFTLLSRLSLGLPVSDFTCGFKCYTERAAKLLFSQSRVERWGFDSELMFLAKQFELSLKEIPVVWKNDPRTKVRFPQDIFRSLADIIAVRRNHLTGRYKK